MSALIAFGFKQIYLTDSNVFSIDFGVFFVGYFRGPANISLFVCNDFQPSRRITSKISFWDEQI